MILENLKELRSIANAKESEYSYVSMLARLIDLLNPTHQFQATVLAYPLFGLQLLKRRLLSLDYDLGTNTDETFNLDNKTAVGIIKQMLKRLESDMRAYYEFSVPYKTTWTIGNNSTWQGLKGPINISLLKDTGRPGEEINSFGITSDGNILYNGIELP